MNVVNWFEIPVKDIKRAKAFYQTVLQKEMVDMESPIPGMEMAAFPWDQGGPNATGSLVRAEGMTPRADGVVVYFQCDDVANELSRVEAAGGKIVTPKVPIGPHGFIAQLIDSEGNRVGLHSQK